MKEIKTTSNYGMFRYMAGNREVRSTNKLEASMRKFGFIESCPIIVNSEMEIIDGQHRLAAAKKLSLPVSYVVEDNGGSIDEVRTINSSKKNWTTWDYIESYANTGKKAYQKIIEYSQKYPELTKMSLLKTLSGKNLDLNAIKTGNTLINVEESENRLSWVSTFLPYAPKSGWSGNYIGALLFIYERQLIPKSKLLAAFESQKDNPRFSLKYTGKIPEVLESIEELYNYKKTQENRVYLKTEWLKSGKKGTRV